jgi:hypothetical protein
MEKPTSNNLEQLLQDWREELAQSPTLKPENVEELELHLRDSIGALQAVGLSETEAFTVAASRLGKRGVLENEYGKINRRNLWLHRVLWMLIGIQAWSFLAATANMFVENATFFLFKSVGYHFVRGTNLFGSVTIFCLTQLIGVLAALRVCWWILNGRSERFSGWLSKQLISWKGAAAIFSAMLALWLVIFGFNAALTMLKIKLAGTSEFGSYAVTVSYSSAIQRCIQTAVFIGATIFLARRQLRLQDFRRLPN